MQKTMYTMLLFCKKEKICMYVIIFAKRNTGKTNQKLTNWLPMGNKNRITG